MATRSKLVATLLVLAPGVAAAQRAPSGSSTVTIPFASAADPADVSGQEINPAGLGFLQRWALAYYGLLGLEGNEANQGNSFFLGLGGDRGISAGLGLLTGAGGQVNFFDSNLAAAPFTKLSYSMSARAGKSLSVGASVARFFSDGDAALDSLATWDAGLIYRPNKHLSIGVAGYDLNTPATTNVNGERVIIPASVDAGVALRPLGNERFTVRADVSAGQPSAVAPDGLLPRATVQLQPIKGVVLNGAVEFDSGFAPVGFQGGLTINLANFGAGGSFVQTGINSAEGPSNLVGVSARLSGERYPSLPRKEDPIIAELALSGGLDEKPEGSGRLLEKGLGESSKERSLYGLVRALETAAKDEKVQAVVFTMSGFSPNAAQTEEVLVAISKLRAANKKCYVYMDSASGREYQIATACDEIVLSPGGMVMLAGVSSQTPFYREALDNFGVEPQYVRIGPYKSAPESYTETEPTSQNVEVREQLLDDLYEGLVAQIAEGRKLPADKVKELIDSGPFTASEAKKNGLIDGTEYFDEFKERLKDATTLEWETPSDEAPEQMSWGASREPEVMVIVVSGTITQGKSRGGGLIGASTSGDDTIIKALTRARESKNVKAVVLRVDSPGGDALASDLIWHEVERVKAEKKPVIVSMGGVAASGGYYIAAGGDEIFADNATITGSIGIFGGKFVLAGLYDNLGIKYYTAKRGARADWQSALRPWTEEERAAYLTKLNEFYGIFISKVAAGRGLEVAQVDALGQGRVYTGKRALGLKLVTKTGGLADAISSAKEKAGIDGEAKVSFYPKTERSALSSLAGLAQSKIGKKLGLNVEEDLPALPPVIQEAIHLNVPGVLYLDPNIPWMLMPELFY